ERDAGLLLRAEHAWDGGRRLRIELDRRVGRGEQREWRGGGGRLFAEYGDWRHRLDSALPATGRMQLHVRCERHRAIVATSKLGHRNLLARTKNTDQTGTSLLYLFFGLCSPTCLRGPGCPDPLKQEKRGEGDTAIIAYVPGFASPNF